jgi:uncharacterized protein YdeI (YjbR/CyaY-like superfamily)
MDPLFFSSAAEFRAWLEKNHERATELEVGFYKKHTKRATMTWSQSVDVALCFGWIDGIRRRIDDDRYQIRFTPRRSGSIWSAVNIQKMAELEQAGSMTDAGRQAFDKKTVARSKVYSYERENASLAPDYEREIEKNKQAMVFWRELSKSRKRATSHWVMSAKKEETRQRRLKILIESAEQGQVIPMLRRN